MNRLLMLLLILLVVAAGMGAITVRNNLLTPLEALTQPVLYEVKPGASLSGVAYDLGDIGLLPRPALFVAWGRFTGQAAALKTGEYEFQPGMSAKGILDQLVDPAEQGDVTTEKPRKGDEDHA